MHEVISRESKEKENQPRENDLSSMAKEDETFEGLLTTNVFPWGVFSKHASTRINRLAFKVGNLIQAMIFLLWIPHNLYYQFFITINIPEFYSPVYLETKENCSTYYLFNSTILKHYIVDLKEGNGSNETLVDANCLHLPHIVFGTVLVWLLHGVMAVGWTLTIDRRYGLLKISHESVVVNLRQKHPMIQLPIILILMPFNIIFALIMILFGIRFVPFIAALTYILKIIIEAITTSNTFCPPVKIPIDRIGSKIFRDSDVSFMYLFITLLDALTSLIPLLIFLFTGNNRKCLCINISL